MNTKAIRQLADVTLDKYRSSIPRKAFEEFVKDIITGENRATAFRYEASPICRASFPSTLDEDGARCTVEVTVYRLNAVAVTAFLLDGPETLQGSSVSSSVAGKDPRQIRAASYFIPFVFFMWLAPFKIKIVGWVR